MINPIKGGSSEVIQGLTCHIPPVPQKHLIAGFELPKKEQLWRRTELPLEWEEWREEEDIALGEDKDYVHPKIHAFVSQEWDRRLNGHWFYNNGKPTYITGKHYFYVNWWKLDSGYPDYRDTDRKLFYFWQYCTEDPDCYGMVELTARRQGKSYRATSEMYEEISKPPQKRSGGMQSKTGDDAEELFKEKLVEPWKDLPDFFKPEHNTGSDPKTEIRFYSDIKRGLKGKRIKHSEENELRSHIDWKNAKEVAYDGKKKFRLIHDEAGKVDPKEADAYKRWEVCKPILKENGRVAGKMYMTTTVEEMDKGGALFQKIWDESDHVAPRNEIGETKSGLYRYFLPAYEAEYYNQYGIAAVDDPTKDEKDFLIKKYGKKAENGARAMFDAVRRGLESDQRALYSYKRKYPYTPEEAFYSDADRCEFNIYVLRNRKNDLEIYKNTYTQGDFEWVAEKDGRVKFISNPTGRFKVAFLPDIDGQNLVKIRGQYANKPLWHPLNTTKFVIGIDPVDHGAQTVEGKPSNAAAYVFRKFDLNVDRQDCVFDQSDLKSDPFCEWKIGRSNWKTNIPVVQYINRPPDPRDFYEDMIKMMRFYGCKVLVENQKQGLLNHMRERGYEDFLMNRPAFTFTKDSQTQDTPGIPSSTPMIQQYTEKIAIWVQNFGHLNPFRELNDDLIVFKPSKPREYDPTVAFGFTLIAAENKDDIKRSMINVEDLFPVYKDVG